MIEMKGDDSKSKEKGTKCKECDISKSDTPKLKKPKQEVDEDKKSSQLPENKDTGKDKADGSDISPNNAEHVKHKDGLSKHLCNKCGIYFDTTCILTKPINKFYKFDQSDEDNDDLQVVYDDNEKPPCIKDFHIEINDNICGEYGLKFLTGKMLNKHNAKHHPKEDEVIEKLPKGQNTGGKQNDGEEEIALKKKDVIKKEVGMDIKCVKCFESFISKQDLQIHMINEHQKDTKYKKHKYQMTEKVSSWQYISAQRNLRSTVISFLTSRLISYTSKKNMLNHPLPRCMALIV